MFWHEWYVCVLLSCVGQSPVEPGSHADVPWLPEVSCQASAPPRHRALPSLGCRGSSP
ncbi:MAG: hypothetical protein KatS3mg114_0014 [Planctomycetaceae bacterium]|nr:MAG: hypothetical protein KatS3mg114_0014 [Planctomycetaceae bacterium]